MEHTKKLKNANQRENIHVLARYSDVSKETLRTVFKRRVYPDQHVWHDFLRLFFLCLGIGFTVSAVVFFFAYNWADLSKFWKLGLLQGLLFGTTIYAVWPKVPSLTRNVLLMGSALLVGVLFAVFGQIYQTGANAYDFFLAWCLCISIWVFVANFPPLWLLYILLISTTIVLYEQQVARHWASSTLLHLLFLLHTGIVFFCIGIQRYDKIRNIPTYFLNIVALSAVACSTIGVVGGIFRSYQAPFGYFLFSTAVVYSAGLWYGIRKRSTFYLALIPFSIIILLSACIMDIWDGQAMFVVVGIFIVLSVTIVIKNLLHLSNKTRS
ncbi:DUF2157 domain-containing protein [Sphingobacterium suaedae]|uniref:DUF2157 domain-containing protein n=1 Tax=Sphingobacterium suaedae TaxID=1686402 RepID=A0ABW5KDN3_9SPHI